MRVQHDIRDQERDHGDSEFVLQRKVSGGTECNGCQGREVHPPDRIGMSEEPGRDTKCDRRDDEKERRNHFGESIRSARYAKGICCSRVSVKGAGARCKHISVTPSRKPGGYNYFAPARALVSRTLRRFAAFSWMIPRLAALSIAETKARICSWLAVCPERTVFCIVRRRVTTLRFRSDRFSVCRARLAADFVLAIGNQKLRGRARSRADCDCQPRTFSKSEFTPTPQMAHPSKDSALQPFV